MNSIEILLSALAGAITLLVTGGYYVLNRLKSLESEAKERHETDLAAARLENDKLRSRVTDLELLLGTFREQLTDVQARLSKAELALDSAMNELEKAQKENRRLEGELAVECEKAARLNIQNQTYRDALALVGADRKASAEKVQPGEEQSEEKKAEA